jgi:DNA-binding transcriptional ArsR family regulator
MPEEPAARPPLRRLSDPRELRALAHPVRMSLVEILGLNRVLTATQASKILGGSPSSVAYHLRTLAKYGYVEETEGGAGRERPWRLTNIGFSFSEDGEDPEATEAAGALGRVLFKRWLERHEEYRRNRGAWPQAVREVAGGSNTIVFGTSEEVGELLAGFSRLSEKFLDRIGDPSLRPEGSHIFELQLFTHPIDATPYEPEAESESESDDQA